MEIPPVHIIDRFPMSRLTHKAHSRRIRSDLLVTIFLVVGEMLRGRLFLLVIAATVPGLALILYEISEQQDLTTVVAEQSAEHVTHEVSSNRKRILEGHINSS